MPHSALRRGDAGAAIPNPSSGSGCPPVRIHGRLASKPHLRSEDVCLEVSRGKPSTLSYSILGDPTSKQHSLTLTRSLPFTTCSTVVSAPMREASLPPEAFMAAPPGKNSLPRSLSQGAPGTNTIFTILLIILMVLLARAHACLASCMQSTAFFIALTIEHIACRGIYSRPTPWTGVKALSSAARRSLRCSFWVAERIKLVHNVALGWTLSSTACAREQRTPRKIIDSLSRGLLHHSTAAARSRTQVGCSALLALIIYIFYTLYMSGTCWSSCRMDQPPLRFQNCDPEAAGNEAGYRRYWDHRGTCGKGGKDKEG